MHWTIRFNDIYILHFHSWIQFFLYKWYYQHTNLSAKTWKLTWCHHFALMTPNFPFISSFKWDFESQIWYLYIMLISITNALEQQERMPFYVNPSRFSYELDRFEHQNAVKCDCGPFLFCFCFLDISNNLLRILRIHTKF